MPEPKSFQLARQIFLQHDGQLRTMRAIRLGIAPKVLYAMRDAGLIIQEGRGLYRLAEALPPEYPDLVQVARLVPKAIICLVSALAFHDLTDRLPAQVYIMLPRHTKAPRLAYPPLRVFRRAEKPYGAGIEVYTIQNVIISVYSREKTIADCFYFATEVGQETILEALKAYKSQKRINRTALMDYGRLNKVSERMRPYLEALF